MRNKRMLGPAKFYFLIFGVLTIAGGVMGYVKAKSTVSLVAGLVAGILLLLAAYLIPEHVRRGLALGGLVSLLLILQFLPKFLRTKKVMPAGMMSLLSIIGIVVAVIAWLNR